MHDKEFLDALHRTFEAECGRLADTALPDIVPSARFTAHMARLMRHRHRPRTNADAEQMRTASADCTAPRQGHSLLQTVIGTLAAAAVIAIVAGSAMLIVRLNQRLETVTPGTEISADSVSDSIVPNTAALPIAVDADARFPEVPEAEQNFLGGRGEIVTIAPARRNTAGAAHPVLKDDLFLYWDHYRTCIEEGSAWLMTNTLYREYAARYASLLSDGSALYYADGTELFRIDSKGAQTPLYAFPETSEVTFTQVLTLGADNGGAPWYFISGYRGMRNVSAVFPFAIVFQPATGKALDLSDRIDRNTEARWEFQTDGMALVGLNHRTNTLTVFTDPDADWRKTEIALQETANIAAWQFTGDTVRYAVTYSDKTVLCDFSLKDGTRRTRELEGASADVILTPAQLVRMTQRASESDSSLMDITVTMTDQNRLLDGGGENVLWEMREMPPETGQALRAASDGAVLFYSADGQRAFYAPDRQESD